MYNANYHIALATLRLNKTEEAKKMYEQLMASEPESISPVIDEAIKDLKNLIKDGVLVEECRYIIEHILKGKAD